MVKLILQKLGIIPKSVKVKKPSNLPYYLVRLENAAILLLSLYYYFFIYKASWIMFIILFITPDLALAAYAFSLRSGAIVYDLVHTYIAPGLLLGIGIYASMPLLVSLSLIWCAHIAQDRMRGFGFKYTDTYDGSHLHKL